MPQIIKAPPETPDGLKAYVSHGVEISFRPGVRESHGQCPFCGKEEKFYVNTETGEFKCHRCGASGNSRIFVRKLWELSREGTNYADMVTTEFVQNRGFLSYEGLKAWGVVRSAITGEWLVPGYGADGSLNQLYRYTEVQDGTKRRMALLPTFGLGHALFGVCLYDRKKPNTSICEGAWDGIALWEILGRTKESGGRYVETGNPAASLLATTNVLAVPSCTVFAGSWLPLFAGKDVALLYDNDHPRKHPKTGAIVPPAAYGGMQRVAVTLAGSNHPPKSTHYLHWGDKGYDPNRKSGYDVRDWLTSASDRRQSLKEILATIRPVPKDWVFGTSAQAKSGTLPLLPCSDYKTLINAWRKAMKWIDGLDHGFTCMLAVVISTPSIGDQLWLKLISPPSTGKSSLCEALSVARKYVFPTDTFTGLTSGYQMDKDGTQNLSLIHKIRGKTMIINDGDTFLNLPNLDVVMSELRAFYGCNLRVQFKNKMSADNEGMRTTVILSGTSSLKQLDSSELGERFLDAVIMDEIEDDLEDDILERVAYRAERNLNVEANGEAETQQDPDMTLAMQLTGGYVEYLREHAIEIISKIDFSDETRTICTRLGKFIAFMRARPSKKQDELAERELAARLVSQMIRMAKCLAAVTNKSSVDEEVLARIHKVAFDTARGHTLNITNFLFAIDREEGSTVAAIALLLNISDDKTRTYLRFLRKIGVLETFVIDSVRGIKHHHKWRLTEKVSKLYEECVHA